MSFKFFPILQTLERKAVFFERKKEAKKREFLLVSFSKCCSFRFRDYTMQTKSNDIKNSVILLFIIIPDCFLLFSRRLGTISVVQAMPQT